MTYLEALREQFNGRVALRERRPGLHQLVVPLYHEDGDMLDIFLEQAPSDGGRIRISDCGMTLMRLSYSFELNTPAKERIFQRILSENCVSEENGTMFIDAAPQSICPALLQFAQTVAKVSNMRLYKREVVQSMFYEMLGEFVEESLAKYRPTAHVTPIPDRDDLEVDYQFDVGRRPIYLFGVRDAAKARLAAICCLEFQRASIIFKSFIVHEDFEGLGRKDRMRITSAADKQFVSLDDFRDHATDFLEREVA